MRLGALGLTIAIALAGATACQRPRTKVAPPQPGTGGASRAGIEPPEPIPPDQIHPNARLREDAMSGTVRGEVVETTWTRVVIADKDGHRFWLTLTPNTVVTQNGKTVSALAIKNGVEVTATFITEETGQRKLITRADVETPIPQR